jgi:hypothetical protein
VPQPTALARAPGHEDVIILWNPEHEQTKVLANIPEITIKNKRDEIRMLMNTKVECTNITRGGQK